MAGAEILEKHIALRNQKGLDYDFSIKEDETKNLLKLLIKLDHCWDQDILIGQKVKKKQKIQEIYIYCRKYQKDICQKKY